VAVLRGFSFFLPPSPEQRQALFLSPHIAICMKKQRSIFIPALALFLLASFFLSCQTTTSETSTEPEAKAEASFVDLFDGKTLDGWVGNKQSYQAKDGMIVVVPEGGGSGGNLFTEKEYSDFHLRFEFQLTPGANNGLGIHAPLEGDVAYQGKELQILDNTAEKYAELEPYQYHGSVYGIIPAKRGFLKPVGEWNSEEVIVQGSKVQVILNGTSIVDGDFLEASKDGTMDHKDHPGLQRTSGHLGFLGHGDVLRFRNLQIKEL
jgi:hypothetical protein